jgi:Domain of unknown function (DUF6745)
MKTRNPVRQGDILLIPTNITIPPDTKVDRDPRGRLVLAEGEVTGHAHCILDDTATLFRQVDEIASEENVEVRRIMIDRYGAGRWLKDGGAKLVRQDDWGKLWRLEQPGDEPLVMVEMVNSTPEPDGSVKTYFERVPPTMTSPLEALAWQAEMTPMEYAQLGTQT